MEAPLKADFLPPGTHRCWRDGTHGATDPGCYGPRLTARPQQDQLGPRRVVALWRRLRAANIATTGLPRASSSASAQVHLVNSRHHEPHEVILGQPVTKTRRHQQHLLTITLNEVLGHARIVLNPPDSTPPLYATATARSDCVPPRQRVSLPTAEMSPTASARPRSAPSPCRTAAERPLGTRLYPRERQFSGLPRRWMPTPSKRWLSTESR